MMPLPSWRAPVDKHSSEIKHPCSFSPCRVGAKNIASSSGCAVTRSTREAQGRRRSSMGAKDAQIQSIFVSVENLRTPSALDADERYDVASVLPDDGPLLLVRVR